MNIEMNNPYGLILLPLMLLFIGWSVKKQKGVHLSKQVILSRIMIFLLLIIALCDPSVKVKGKNGATIFLLDLSDSMRASRMESKAFIDDALLNLPKDHQAGVIIFGKSAQIDKFINEAKQYDHIGDSVVTSATNIEQAIQLAIAYLPEEANKEIVLLTDGGENEGDMQAVSALLKDTNIDLKVRLVDHLEDGEIYIDKLSVPERTYKNETFTVSTTVISNIKTKAMLTLYSGGLKKSEQEIELEVGENTFVFQDIEAQGGFKSYRVRVSALDDHEMANNEYSCYTTVEDFPKLLIIEGKEGEALGIDWTLKEMGQESQIISPEEAPTSLETLMAYQSIMLCNVYYDDLAKGFTDSIEAYVNNGGGLIVSGGDDSFALGGYQNTEIEKILPVDLHKKGNMEHAGVSLCLVIDHSGSMSDGLGGRSKLKMSLEAAAKVIDYLNEEDEISVFSFDDSYTEVVSRQKVTDKDQIKSLLFGITDGGGTSIYPALEAAYKQQADSASSVKHIILLTDGQDSFGISEYNELITKINNAHISLSTVAVGDGANIGLLKALAEQGKGSHYVARTTSELPKIFAKEYFLSTGEYLINESFMAKPLMDHDILKGLEGEVPLMGYIGTTIKPLATEVLTSHHNEPILALWHYGLGKVVAWTSDVSGQWSQSLLKTDQGLQLFKNMLSWSMTTYEGDGKVSIEEAGENAKIIFSSANMQATKDVHIIYENEAHEQKQLQLEEKVPGTYEGELPLDETGFYIVNTVETLQDGSSVHYISAFTKQYSKEFKFNQSTDKLLQLVEKAEGRLINYPNEVFKLENKVSYRMYGLRMFCLICAYFFFLIDILARRFQWDLEKYFKCSDKWSSYLSTLAHTMRKFTHKRSIQQVVSTDVTAEDCDSDQVISTHHKKQIAATEAKGRKEKESIKKEVKKEKKVKAQAPQLDTASLLQKKKERQ